MHQTGILFITQRTVNWVLVFRMKITQIVNANDYSLLRFIKAKESITMFGSKGRTSVIQVSDIGYTFRTNHANIRASELAKHSEKKCFIMKNEPIFRFQQRIRRHNNYRLSQTELSCSYFC